MVELPRGVPVIQFSRMLGVVALILFSLLGRASEVGAQEFHVDAHVGANPHAAIRAEPKGYESRTFGNVRYVFPREFRGRVQGLERTRVQAWADLSTDLGTTPDSALEVRVGKDIDALRELGPQGVPPPGYAVGVAYPGLGLILLSLAEPTSWQPTEIEQVFTHELSHMALHRAVGSADLPLWFIEGLAVGHAQERSFERSRVLVEATLRGRLVPLRRLSESFPEGTADVSVAYAQSAAFVAYLRRETNDARRFRSLLERVRHSTPFDEAFRAAYGVPLEKLDSEWRSEAQGRYGALPLFFTGAGVWGFASVLLVIAFARYRKRRKLKLRLMELEEAGQLVEARRELALDYDEPSRATIPSEIPAHIASTDSLLPGEPPIGVETRERRAPAGDSWPSGPVARVRPIPTVEIDGQRRNVH